MGANEAQLAPLDPPTTPSGEDGYPKNRYVSFVPVNAGQLTAYRIVLAGTRDQRFENSLWSHAYR